ncbi:MAG TPA: CpsD/CapB family tyrosine-protein kinase, partial [Terriglobales bacterium]|nr:CpsD/CapB family tyrosine-protein kinase [Terriglobales bacterium]
DGKSTVSANLALTLATHGERTLLLDGDLHQPALARMLGITVQKGLANANHGSEALVNLLHRARTLPLWFLPAGRSSQQPLTIIQSTTTTELLKQLASSFTWIIIDSPPLIPLADAAVWAGLSDAVLVVARQGCTPKKALEKAIGSFEKSKVFGMIMNDGNAKEQRYYREYHAAKVSDGVTAIEK